jgi:hypothetical protein
VWRGLDRPGRNPCRGARAASRRRRREQAPALRRHWPRVPRPPCGSVGVQAWRSRRVSAYSLDNRRQHRRSGQRRGNAFANELPSNHAAEAARGGLDVAWADSGGRCQRYDPFLNRVTPVRIWPRASLLTRNFATLQTAGGARIGRRWESDWESTRHRVPHGRSVRRAHQGAAAWRLLADRVLQHRPAQEM